MDRRGARVQEVRVQGLVWGRESGGVSTEAAYASGGLKRNCGS